MLFEKTTYLDDFPIKIRIARVTEYPFHYHQDVEFIYVLKGEIALKNVCHHYLLKEGDIFTNSGHEVHGLTATDKENVVAIIQVSNRFFTQYFPTLGKACFMSYVNDDKYLKMDTLRKMLLHILLDYSRRSFNYKSTCIDQMIEVIKYLNQYFNLFAFEGEVVVNFQNDNSIAVERISRIINYVYANHASKITLEDLAEREHLSTFYISHLIRDYMGINFQELLCFARAEMSEILLLETDRKISAIARDVGFSTTSYYDKFFSKWFGHTPSEYRQLYMPHILSAARPARFELFSDNQAVSLIRRCMSAVSDQEKNASVINRLHLTVDVNPQTTPVMNIRHFLEVVITQEDYHIMGERLFNLLYDLNASKVILAFRQGDSETTTALIANRLSFIGYNVSTVCDNGLCCGSSAGYDSIVAAIHIFRTYFISKENNLHCKLRDQGDPSKILKGAPSCITSSLIPKPSFYAYRLLKNIKGKLLYWGKYYYVIKNDLSERDSYTLAVINYNDDIQNLYMRNAGAYEVNDIINSFKDELQVDFSIPVESGQYVIAKYALSNANSIFAHMSHLEFPEDFPLSEAWVHMLNTEPPAQVSIENVDDRLHITSTIKGTGIHIIVVEKVGGTD
ncbi:AraC family transcriptional regulator [Aminipila butyrica]|uniref:AraC family transcriptional regulator n=1 Tax=Aminipila butyrica TaxID=433296 RepID=A0A858C0Y7_9FIRM|nr:AraC family transcriptional regulator [Aminipila butyrica]QIB70076.1 AraC family transcriptional regulator [Aminipila butyrica]